MKATTLLRRQHRNLEQVCEAVGRGSQSMRESLLPQLAGDLAAHIAVEEQIFYPAIARLVRNDSWLRENRQRGVRLRQLLDRVLESAPCGQEFEQAIALLRESLASHTENEEDVFFPQVERVLDEAAMRELAKAMMALYQVKVETGYVRERCVVRSPPHGRSLSPSR